MTDKPLVENEVQRLMEHCRATLDMSNLTHLQDYRSANLPICVIETVFSINASDTSTRNTVDRFCTFAGIAKSADAQHPNQPEYSIADFIAIHSTNSVDDMAQQVYKNRQRTSTNNGILKAEAALRVAQILAQFEVNTLADVEKVFNLPEFEAAFRQIPGQKSGVSLRLFYMLLGSEDNIKPDRMIMRFIHAALGRTPNVDEAHQLIVAAARALQADYPKLTPRRLDNLIWEFQRTQ